VPEAEVVQNRQFISTCMTTLQLLQERRRAAMEQDYRDFEEQRRRDIHDYDEVDGRSQHEGYIFIYMNLHMIWLYQPIRTVLVPLI